MKDFRKLFTFLRRLLLECYHFVRYLWSIFTRFLIVGAIPVTSPSLFTNRVTYFYMFSVQHLVPSNTHTCTPRDRSNQWPFHAKPHPRRRISRELPLEPLPLRCSRAGRSVWHPRVDDLPREPPPARSREVGCVVWGPRCATRNVGRRGHGRNAWSSQALESCGQSVSRQRSARVRLPCTCPRSAVQHGRTLLLRLCVCVRLLAAAYVSRLFVPVSTSPLLAAHCDALFLPGSNSPPSQQQWRTPSCRAALTLATGAKCRFARRASSRRATWPSCISAIASKRFASGSSRRGVFRDLVLTTEKTGRVQRQDRLLWRNVREKYSGCELRATCSSGLFVQPDVPRFLFRCKFRVDLEL